MSLKIFEERCKLIFKPRAVLTSEPLERFNVYGLNSARFKYASPGRLVGRSTGEKKLHLSIINASEMTVKPKMYTVVDFPFGLFFGDGRCASKR